MTHDAAVLKAHEIANCVLAPSAGQNDKAGRFSTEAVEALGASGLLGLLLPVDLGGSGLGPRTFAVVTATLAEADASVAMVYLMHILGTATISAARPSAAQAVKPILQEIGAGRHAGLADKTPVGLFNSSTSYGLGSPCDNIVWGPSGPD